MYDNNVKADKATDPATSDPYPFAIDEAYDTYRVLVESRKCDVSADRDS